jgi:hypothetical protein
MSSDTSIDTLNSPQVNIAPPPPSKHDAPKLQNTTILAEHKRTSFLIFYLIYYRNYSVAQNFQKEIQKGKLRR